MVRGMHGKCMNKYKRKKGLLFLRNNGKIGVSRSRLRGQGYVRRGPVPVPERKLTANEQYNH